MSDAVFFMRSFTTYLVTLFLILLVGVSCIDRPEYVLDEEQMIDLLVDVHKAEGLMETQDRRGNDMEYQKQIMAAVLVDHGVSRAQYDSSLMWYARHLKLLVRVYSHVDERLSEEFDKWSALSTDIKDFATSEAGDSVQIWSMRDYLVLDHKQMLDRRFWELEPDSNYLSGDTLRWSFDVNHLIAGQQLLASISFVPSGQNTVLITSNGMQEITAVPDSMQAFTKAHISVVLVAPDSVKQQSPVFLNHISLIRYHRE